MQGLAITGQHGLPCSHQPGPATDSTCICSVQIRPRLLKTCTPFQLQSRLPADTACLQRLPLIFEAARVCRGAHQRIDGRWREECYDRRSSLVDSDWGGPAQEPYLILHHKQRLRPHKRTRWAAFRALIGYKTRCASARGVCVSMEARFYLRVSLT